MPPRISIVSSLSTPATTSTGKKAPEPRASMTKSPCPVRMTAELGSTRAECAVARIDTSTSVPRRRSADVRCNTTRACVRNESSSGLMKSSLASIGSASPARTTTLSPGCTSADWPAESETSIHTVVGSASVRIGATRETKKAHRPRVDLGHHAATRRTHLDHFDRRPELLQTLDCFDVQVVSHELFSLLLRIAQQIHDVFVFLL